MLGNKMDLQFGSVFINPVTYTDHLSWVCTLPAVTSTFDKRLIMHE